METLDENYLGYNKSGVYIIDIVKLNCYYSALIAILIRTDFELKLAYSLNF